MKGAALALASLTDDQLLSRTLEVAARGRRVEATLVWHLAEVDERRLYLREACSSMFAYATERLHLSEHEAYLRIAVARISRRFPQVLAMLAEGKLHLSAIARLGPHLTAQGADALLARAVHASRRTVDLLVAELAPRPDPPEAIRKLPERPAAPPSSARELVSDRVEDPAPARSATVRPTAPARFSVQFSASSELEDKIRRAQALARHRIPSGDLAALFDLALTRLLAELERDAFAATSRPRATVAEVGPAAAPSSRHIPAAIRRAVWERDGGRCTYVDRRGRRCSCRDWLEFHHEVPFGQGGDHAASNVKLLCRSHNAYQAELDYGRELVERARRGPRPAASPVGAARADTT